MGDSYLGSGGTAGAASCPAQAPGALPPASGDGAADAG